MPEPSDAAPPRIELIGAPALSGVAGERVRLERKAAALLALLAIEGSRPRALLAAWLWPAAAPAQARNSLRQRLFKLQRAAGVELVVGQDHLRLADGVAVDLAEAAARLAGDVHAAGGELLEGHDYADSVELGAWVDAARERWRRQRADALAEASARHESRQQVALALQYAQRLLDDDLLLEHAHRRVMRLHYLRGDRAAALAAYQRCKAVLREQLGTAPDRETQALAAAIGTPGAASPVRALAPPISVLRPPRLVGREQPFAQLTQAVADSGLVLLMGEPGIGKSRLLQALADAAPALLAGGSLAGDARVPYALLARLAARALERWPCALPDWAVPELARLVPALGAAPAARLDALRMQQAFGAALAAWRDAGLAGLIVDDLHHADDASLECLLALAAVLPRRLAWLFSVRSQEMPALLQQALQAGAPQGLQRLPLALLDAPQVGELLESLQLDSFDSARWTAQLARHSGGNPLFALETVRALLALGADAAPGAGTRLPVPAALDTLIERRLAQLGEPALRLARVAALAGADFDAVVAADVLDAHPLDLVDPWRELESAQLLQHGRFTHDLVAEAVLQTLPQAIAELLHARLAGALQRLGRGAARVAPHWAAASSWALAAEAYANAARDARRASRRSDEAALWQQAADGFDRAGQPGKAFDARADSVECVILCQGTDAASQLVDRLDADQRTEPQRMRALTSRACVCLMAGRANEGEAVARAALDTATRLGALWPRFEAARLLAVALAQAGRADEALAAIEPFREPVVAHGDAEQRHHFWSDYAYALKAAQRAHDTAAALREAMASAQQAGDHAELATLTSNLALIEGNLGRAEHALDHARRARALNDPLGLAVGPPAGAIELYVSVHEGALGRYSEALAGFERAQACFAGNPNTVWIGLTGNHLAHVLMHLGQYARAQQALGWGGSSSPTTESRRELLRARLARVQGRRGEVSMQQVLAGLDGIDPVSHMLVRLEATLDQPGEAAAAACDALVDEAERGEHLAVAMRARLLRAWHRSAAATLRGSEADALAARLRDCHPADTYLGEAWWIVVCAFDHLGQRKPADAALRQAFEWVAQRALPQVPPAFRHGFVERNPVNRALLAAAARRLDLHVGAAAQ